MDRPRRALFEEPDNVESYVAKRSLGITQADTGDRIVVRPARATRALEPGAAGNQAQAAGRDQLGRSHPPTPRRALPAEPLSWDLEAPKASPTEPAAAGRRAIVDLEQTPVSGPVVPSPPTVPLAVRPTALEPRGIEPSPLREAAGDLPKIIAGAEPPPDPIFVPAPPAPTTPVPIPMPAPTEQQQLYWPALPSRSNTAATADSSGVSTGAANQTCRAGSGTLARADADASSTSVQTNRRSRRGLVWTPGQTCQLGGPP